MVHSSDNVTGPSSPFGRDRGITSVKSAMKLEQIIAYSDEEILEYILSSRGLSKHPPPCAPVWRILPSNIVRFLACVRERQIQVGDFIVFRARDIEREWAVSLERLEGDWIPITLGISEIGEGFVVSYNRSGDFCIDPINLVRGGPVIQGEVVAPDFNSFLRLQLILDTIESDRLINEEKGVVNQSGQQKMERALNIFYPNYGKSQYWSSWLDR